MKVTLLIPGLFTTFRELSPDALDAAPLPALRLLLSRARRHAVPASDVHRWLYRQFTQDDDDQAPLPYAAITARLDLPEQFASTQPGHWLRADPVYLYPDTHALILQDPAGLCLSEEEAGAIAETLIPFFAEDGLRLYAPNQQRWYLQLPAPPEIRTMPPQAVLGQAVNDHLPQGADKRCWHVLFNEVQMLLNQHPVNQARQANGLPPVNSLWFWGEGSLHEQLTSPFCGTIGDDDLLHGLCELAGVVCLPSGAISLDILCEREAGVLLMRDELDRPARLNEPQAWLEQLQMLEQSVFAPLLLGLQQGLIGQLRLVTGGPLEFVCRLSDLRRFWRRRQPLSRWLSS